MDIPIVWRIKKRQQPGPNCEWKIERPDLGMVGKGTTFDQTLRSAIAYRESNGIPVGLEFEDELEQAICREYGYKHCVSTDPRAPIKVAHLKLHDVVVGTKVMIQFYKSGKQVVSREEAERRADICKQCKLRTSFALGCGGTVCGTLAEIVQSIVGQHSESIEQKVGTSACMICHCFLKVAVWLPLETQVPPLSEHQKIQFEQVDKCWKKSSLLQNH